MSLTSYAISFNTAHDDASIGSYGWNGLENNALVADDVYAATGAGGQYGAPTTWLVGNLSNTLRCSPDAVIKGILGTLEGRFTGTFVSTSSVPQAQLQIGDVFVGDIKTAAAMSEPGFGQPDLIREFGGSADLWGTTILNNDINNASGFGMGIAFQTHSPYVYAGAKIDQISMTLYVEPGNMMMAM